MYPLIETIKIVDGVPQNLIWHQRRVDHSVRNYYDTEPVLDLQNIVSIPDEHNRGLVKAKVSYNIKEYHIEFSKYKIKNIRSLKLIYDDQIEYSLKYSDRTVLNILYSQRGACDDILIVKAGQITDTSYCNIVFFDGNRWITPSSSLLEGTCRARLIHTKQIFPQRIEPKDLSSFKCYNLINAMRDFNDTEKINISEIVY